MSNERNVCPACGGFIDNPFCLSCGCFDGSIEDVKCHLGIPFNKECVSINCDMLNHGSDKKVYRFVPDKKWAEKPPRGASGEGKDE